MSKAAIFDLDGTLIHSALDIHAAANVMLEHFGQGEMCLETITTFIGNGATKLVERVIRKAGLDGQVDHGEWYQVFIEYYSDNATNLTKLYPGVLNVLNNLRGDDVKLAVCTNKPVEPTKRILADFEIDGFFDVVIGGDSLSVKKPDPAPLREAINQLGSTTNLYIGDSETDEATARNASVPFALFTEGYRKAPLEDLVYEMKFDDFSNFSSLANDFFKKP